MKKSLISIMMAGILSLASLNSGCANQNLAYHPGFPPRIIKNYDEKTCKGWKREEGFIYMEKVYFEGRWYHPKNLEDARRIENELGTIDARDALEFLDKQKSPRM